MAWNPIKGSEKLYIGGALVPCFLLLMTMVSTACLGPSDITDGTAPETEFHAESHGYEDRILYRYVPDPNQPATNLVTDETTRNGNTVQYGTDLPFDEVSDLRPIEFTVSREQGDTIRITIEIRSESGTLLPGAVS